MVIRRRHDDTLREERLKGPGIKPRDETIRYVLDEDTSGSISSSQPKKIDPTANTYLLIGFSFIFLAIALWLKWIPITFSGPVVLGYELPDFCLGVGILGLIGSLFPKLISVVFMFRGIWGMYTTFTHYAIEEGGGTVSSFGIYWLSFLVSLAMLLLGFILMSKNRS